MGTHFLIFLLINFKVKIDEFLYFEHPGGLLLKQAFLEGGGLHVSIVWEKEECLTLVWITFIKKV